MNNAKALVDWIGNPDRFGCYDHETVDGDRFVNFENVPRETFEGEECDH